MLRRINEERKLLEKWKCGRINLLGTWRHKSLIANIFERKKNVTPGKETYTSEEVSGRCPQENGMKQTVEDRREWLYRQGIVFRFWVGVIFGAHERSFVTIPATVGDVKRNYWNNINAEQVLTIFIIYFRKILATNIMVFCVCIYEKIAIWCIVIQWPMHRGTNKSTPQMLI